MVVFSLVIILLAMFILVIIAAKNHNTFKQRHIILGAIYTYCRDVIDKENFEYREVVYFDDMEPYGKTLFRLYDWGCTRILPKDKYEIIKPYIKENGK